MERSSHDYAVIGRADIIVGTEIVGVGVELIVRAVSARAAVRHSRRVTETLIGARGGSLVSDTMRAVMLPGPEARPM